MKELIMEADQILSIFRISSGTEMVPVTKVREHLDKQSNPLKYANNLLSKLNIPFVGNQKKAYVYVMTMVEYAMKNQVNIEQIIERANQRIHHITDIVGPGAFYVEDDNIEENDIKLHREKLGSKSTRVREIYMQNKDKLDDKSILTIIQKELNISKTNAYTYLYNLKKKLNRK